MIPYVIDQKEASLMKGSSLFEILSKIQDHRSPRAFDFDAGRSVSEDDLTFLQQRLGPL